MNYKQTAAQKQTGYRPTDRGLVGPGGERVRKATDMNEQEIFGSEMELPVPLRKVPSIVDNNHGDGDMVYEYTSGKLKTGRELVNYTVELLKANVEAGGMIHSFYPRKHPPACPCPRCRIDTDVRDEVAQTHLHESVSNHLHASPFDFKTYTNLFWLTHEFHPLFKNSPYIYENGEVRLSLRHDLRDRWSPKTFLAENAFLERLQGREHICMTPNEVGSIEFRRNDLSKSPMTPAFFFYLYRIAKNVPGFLPKIVKSDYVVERFGGRMGVDGMECGSLTRYRKVAADQMREMAKNVDKAYNKALSSHEFYCFYNGRHMSFTDLVNTMVDTELATFEKFSTTKDLGYKRYREWTGYFTRYLEPYTNKRDLCTLNEPIIKKKA